VTVDHGWRQARRVSRHTSLAGIDRGGPVIIVGRNTAMGGKATHEDTICRLTAKSGRKCRTRPGGSVPGGEADGERIVVCTATTSPKVRALSARPDVAITIDVGATPAAAKSLLVRGFAHLETVDGVADEYLEAAKKALDPDTHAAFEGHVRSMYKQQVRISTEPRWARFYDFGAGRVPAFLTELAASA